MMKGGSYFSEELLKKIITSFDRKNTNKSFENIGLNDIETKVMKQICDGFSQDEIAQKLSISLSTVKSHHSKLLEKIGRIYSSNHSLTNLDYSLS